jgi:hypothetical protein
MVQTGTASAARQVGSSSFVRASGDGSLHPLRPGPNAPPVGLGQLGFSLCSRIQAELLESKNIEYSIHATV